MDEREKIGFSMQQQHHCYNPLLYIQNTGKESLYLSKAVTMATKSQEQTRVEYFTLLGSFGPPDVTGQRLLQHLILLLDQVLQIASLGVSTVHAVLQVLLLLNDVFFLGRSRILSCLKTRYSLTSRDLSYHQAPVLSVCCHS